eukprot:m.204047 g.204047  ORF g.204047 m.204047 type:complete len:1201 (+) comp26016_c2_seq1:100-3702(+)
MAQEDQDLATLAFLTEESLNDALRKRYSRQNVYTYMGDILIAINPYEKLPIYDDATAMKYKQALKAQNAPHIFAVADAAFTSAVQSSQNQVVVISGESGAGKTESTKFVISHLLRLCRGVEGSLQYKILQINPLLEAFGNAQTVMNHNSSRFGKFIELLFNEDGLVGGALLSDYLLERSRVVFQDSMERNFHIFYYLLQGIPPHLASSYRLGTHKNFRYLCATDNPLSQAEAQDRWQGVEKCLSVLGITDSVREYIIGLLCGILHVGNINFKENEQTEAALVEDESQLAFAASILLVDDQSLTAALLTSKSYVRGETIIKRFNGRQSTDCRDALAKALYGRFFSWLVQQINGLLMPDAHADARLSIGLLDIFGFENFQKNSFEQFCINLANEQLQFFFNEHIFRMELDEYSKEGISSSSITFVDNKPLLDLFLSKPIGLLSLLDEESKLQSSTDSTLQKKLDTHLSSRQHFSSHASGFTVRHFAGMVQYNVKGMISKNRDRLPDLVEEVMQESKSELVALLFQENAQPKASKFGFSHRLRAAMSSRNKKRRPGPPTSSAMVNSPRAQRSSRRGRKRRGAKTTVGAQFNHSLELLMSKMNPCAPHFVRCIKPNTRALPRQYNDDFIITQLRYTGVLETVRVRREGYPYRPTFDEFLRRFSFFAFGFLEKVKPTAANCQKVLAHVQLKEFAIGKTKVFLKYWHLDHLMGLVMNISKHAIVVQKHVRGFIARRLYARLRAAKQIEDAARKAFFEDMRNASRMFMARLQSVNDEDAARVREAEARRMSLRIEDEKLPPIGSKKFQKTMKKRREEVVRWFREEELPKGALRDPLNPGLVSQPVTPTRAPGNKAQQDIEAAKWFHGLLSRQKAEEMLAGCTVGTFLIRVSESRRGYSLSFVWKNRIKHYKITVTPDGGYAIVGTSKRFDTLFELVAFYQTRPISVQMDQLTVPLGTRVDEDPEDYESRYAELLWDKGKIKAALKAKSVRKKSSRPKPKTPEFSHAVAPLLSEDKDQNIDNTTLVQLQDRFGVRQVANALPGVYPDERALQIVDESAKRQTARSADQFVQDDQAQIRQRHFSVIGQLRPASDSIGNAPAVARRPVVRSPSAMLRHKSIIADAERRIALAHQEWQKANKRKKKGKEKQKQKEKKERQRSKKFRKKAAGNAPLTVMAMTSDGNLQVKKKEDSSHDYREVSTLLKEMDAL